MGNSAVKAARRQRDESIAQAHRELDKQQEQINSTIYANYYAQDRLVTAFYLRLTEEFETSKSNQSELEELATAMIACLDNNIIHIEEILQKSQKNFLFFSIINCNPIHMLLAMHMFHNIDTKDSILKLLKHLSLDYKTNYYGVNPIVDMLKMTGVLRDAVLKRMRKDLAVLCNHGNFVQALELINYEPEYFKANDFISGNRGNILTYATAQAKRSSNKKAWYKFIQKLVKLYNFDINAGSIEYELNQQPVVATSLEEINDKTVAFKDLELKEYALQHLDGQYIASYQMSEIIYSFKKALRNNLGYSEETINNFIRYSQKLKSIAFFNQRITREFSHFLQEYIYPHFKAISFSGCNFNDDVNNGNHGAYSYFAKYPVEHIDIQHCYINDGIMQGFIDDASRSKSLRSIYLQSNRELAGGFFFVLAILLRSNRLEENKGDKFKQCKIEVSHLSVNVEANDLIEIYRHMKDIGKLTELRLMGIPDKTAHQTLSLLAGLLKNYSQLTSIIIHAINLDNHQAIISLTEIIKNAPNLEQITIEYSVVHSIFGYMIKETIDQLLANGKLRKVSVKSCVDFADINIDQNLALLAPNLAPLNQVKQNDENNIIEIINNLPEVKVLNGSRHLLSLDLKAKEFAELDDLFNSVSNTELAADPVAERIDLVKTQLLNNANLQIDKFFKKYIKELSRIEKSNWVGSTSELPILAKILSCKIRLHESEYSSEPNHVYGCEIWDNEIDLVRRGHAYYGYSKDRQVMIPNAHDNLSLFRACIHSSLSVDFYEHCIKNSVEIERCAQQLQIDVANFVKYSQELCEIEYKNKLLKYIEAKTPESIYLAALDLPQINLGCMQQILSIKRKLNLLHNLADSVKQHNINQLHAFQNIYQQLSAQLAASQKSKSTFYNLNSDLSHSIDVKITAIEDIKKFIIAYKEQHYKDLAEEIVQQNKNIMAIHQVFRELVATKDAALKTVTQAINQAKGEVNGQINQAYRNHCRKVKRKMWGSAALSIASYALGNVLAPMLTKIFTAKSFLALSFVNSKIVSHALIASTIDLIRGGKLKDLPLNFITSAALSKMGTFATDKMFKGNIYQPGKEINKVRLIAATHSTVEATGRAIKNGDNVLINAGATAAAHGIVGTALAIDTSKQQYSNVIFSPSVAALNSTFKGSNRDQILDGTVLQVIDSGVTAGAQYVDQSLSFREGDGEQPPTLTGNLAQVVIEKFENKPQQLQSSTNLVVNDSNSVNPKATAKTSVKQSNQQDLEEEELPRTGTSIMAKSIVTYNTREIREQFNKLTPISRKAQPLAILTPRVDKRAQAEQYVLSNVYNQQPQIRDSFGTKVLNFFISPAYAENSPYEQYFQRNREIYAFNRWLSNVHGLSTTSLDPYGKVPEEYRCYVFSTENIQEIEKAYRRLGALEYKNIKTHNLMRANNPAQGLTLDDIDLFQDTEFYERVPESNEAAILGGIGAAILMVPVKAVEFGLDILAAGEEFNAVHNSDDLSKITDYERDRLAQRQKNGAEMVYSLKKIINDSCLINPDSEHAHLNYSVFLHQNAGRVIFSLAYKFAANTGQRITNAVGNRNIDPFMAGYELGSAVIDVAMLGHGAYSLGKKVLKSGNVNRFNNSVCTIEDITLGSNSNNTIISSGGLGFDHPKFTVRKNSSQALFFSQNKLNKESDIIKVAVGTKQVPSPIIKFSSEKSAPKAQGLQVGSINNLGLESQIMNPSKQISSYAQGNKANLAYSGGKTTINHINPTEVRFSQSTVSRSKTRVDPVTREKYTYTFEEIVSSMETNGWSGEPINVVRMPDGGLTAIDNTRLLAARKAGINAEIRIHDYNSKIPASKAREYTAMGKSEPETWGEAIHARISAQQDRYFQDRLFVDKFPNGAVYDPKITGRGPQL